MNVLAFRPREEFCAVVPGVPGPDGDEPVFYERTLNGTESAIVHARLLSAGGGTQYVTLTEGRQTWILRTFRGGRDMPSPEPPVRYPTGIRPASPEDIRPGAPRGHIPEVCTHGKHRAAGTRPRKNRNMPKPSWPGIV